MQHRKLAVCLWEEHSQHSFIKTKGGPNPGNIQQPDLFNQTHIHSNAMKNLICEKLETCEESKNRNMFIIIIDRLPHRHSKIKSSNGQKKRKDLKDEKHSFFSVSDNVDERAIFDGCIVTNLDKIDDGSPN